MQLVRPVWKVRTLFVLNHRSVSKIELDWKGRRVYGGDDAVVAGEVQVKTM